MSVFGDSEDFDLPSGGDEAPALGAAPKEKVTPTPVSDPAPGIKRPAPTLGRPTRPSVSAPAPQRPVQESTAPEVEPEVQAAPVQRQHGLPPSPRLNTPSTVAKPDYNHSVPANKDTESSQLPPAVTQSEPDRYSQPLIQDRRNSFGYDDIKPARKPLEDVPSSVRTYDADEYESQSSIIQRDRLPLVVEEDESADREHETGVPTSSKRSMFGKGSTAAKTKKKTSFSLNPLGSKKPKVSDDNTEESAFFPKGNFAGGRSRVLLTNGIALAFLAGILGVGIYPILNPPAIPSQTDVRALVADQLNLTEFDKDGGRALVSAFVKEYFTFTDESGGVTRADRLTPFMDESLASTLATSTMSTTGTTQAVTDEPYITGIRALDDANAVYNVGVKIGNRWLYVDIPVFYDKRTLAYSISGVPAFTPPPSIAQVGQPSDESMDVDTALQQETEANIISFFKAWAASDSEALSRYITGDADAETRAGLQRTVSFGELTSYEVETKDAEDPTENTRKALATVSWNNSATNPNLSYRQTFELELYRQPDDRWYVADIKPDATQYSVVDPNTVTSQDAAVEPVTEPTTEPNAEPTTGTSEQPSP